MKKKTRNCIVCYEHGVTQGGHVHTMDGEIIIASFCEDHGESDAKPLSPDCVGCCGDWSLHMGKEEFIGLDK